MAVETQEIVNGLCPSYRVHGWQEKERMTKVRKIKEVSGDKTGP